jgi:oxaloacetate decarboxylase gamma subunit
MDYGQLLSDGLKLMVFGMGMVYVFLVVMIFAMKGLEIVLRPFATLLDPPAAAPAAKKASGSSEDANLAAVAAAVVAKMIKK